MKSLASLVLVGLIAQVSLLGTGCADEKDTGTPPPTPATENAYVGATACSTCHAGIATTAGASGHAHMVTAVVNGQKPSSLPRLPDSPPAGRTWAGIKYVIGGWSWKARFVAQDLQVVSGDGAQYSLPHVAPDPTFAGAWSAYAGDEGTTYDYTCFRCHTTGPDEARSVFAEPGVQCEACHGMGKLHALNPRGDNITRDDSAACGRCHSRDPNGARITAKDGFIANHQQYAELKGGKHRDLTCATCHDPHLGTRSGQGGGIVKTCTSAAPCHEGKLVNHRGGGVSPNCIDCHMSRATRSDRSVTAYQGDVRTHLFKIHDGAESQADMFEAVGGNTYVKQGYGVTLDYACYSCHRDEAGVGGDSSTKTLAQLRAKAESIHDTEAMTGR